MNKENMHFRLKLEIDELVNEMVNKLPKELFISKNATFLDPNMGGGQYVHAIEQRLRAQGHREYNIKNRVFGVEKSTWKVNFAVNKHKLVGTYTVDTSDVPSILNTNMKFDCIVGNPPYQRKVGPNNTEPLWHLFVEKSINSLTEGGYLCYVHPSGWRNVKGRYDGTKNLILSKDVEYLEIHDEKDGVDTFGAMTRYDWYILKNSNSTGKTTVKFQNGETKTIDLNALPFIPNGSYDKIVSLLAKKGEDTVDILYDRSAYGTDKKNISKKKVGNFVHPCFYCINKGDNYTIFYSDEKKGHFGIPKFIWSNGYIPSFGTFVDKKGEYGMTQWCYAIIDDPKNLDDIKKAFDSKAFRDLMFDCKMSENSLNRKVLSLFRKDFYKEFI